MSLEDLIAIEQIKKLKAKYLRYMDQRRWGEWANLFAEDATITTFVNDQAFNRWVGKEEVVRECPLAQINNQAVHHGVMPDIEVTGENTAKASWMLDDAAIKPDMVHRCYGYYDDEYVRIDGVWMIKAIACYLYLYVRTAEDRPRAASRA